MFGNMTQQFISEKKIDVDTFDRVPKDIIEKQFIIDFLKSLPIEDLKKLINYKELDYRNQNLWSESPRMHEKLKQLQEQRIVLITADIWLDK